MVFLDTSAYSRLRHGHEAVLDAVAAAEAVLLPATVLDEPYVSSLSTTRAVARGYGQVFAQLRRAGTPIPVNDIWIAAATLDCGGHLLTFDRHFKPVQGLDLTVMRL